MSKYKFKAGDRVRIRQWEDMEREFGLDLDGDIKRYPTFSVNMKPLCGREFVIDSIYDDVVLSNTKDYNFANGRYWNILTYMIEPIGFSEIHITTDGETTYAVQKEAGKVIGRTEARCNPRDTFDFNIGAKLAFERLMKQKEPFVPYLKDISTGKFYGEIGKSTRMKDITGKPLFVGDTVELIDSSSRGNRGKKFVVDGGKVFVMGICSSCNNNGKISRDWIVVKADSYENLTNGQKVDDIKAILEEE